MKHQLIMKHVIILALACAAAPRVPAQNTWNLDGNFVAPGQFLGSTNFQAPVDFVAGGMRVLRLEPDGRTNGTDLSGNVIGGFAGNFVEQPGSGANFIGAGGFPAGPNIVRSNAQGVFIGGGSAHEIGPNVNDAVIGGGFGNRIRSFNSFIGGGRFNRIEPNTISSVIGGGEQNRIEPDAVLAVIGSGFGNKIREGSGSFIGGGNINRIGTNSHFVSIVAGSVNQIQDNAIGSFLGGGQFNAIGNNAVFALLGGGFQNTNGGSYSTLAGGYLNNISGDYSTVSGGEQNSSSGFWATVPGGFQNRAPGQASLAAGALANANHDGSFVWAGGATTNYPSIRLNTFNVYAAGGMIFEYGGQGGGRAAQGRGNRSVLIGLSPGNTIAAWNGARLTDGGVWANASDVHLKTDFNDVDARKILERVAALPVREWRYTNENADVKHLGPTAQDFRAAFGFGDDDKSIGTVDADGVALAAIQGLNQKLEAGSRKSEDRSRSLEEKLEQKQTEITELKRELHELKQLIHSRIHQLTDSRTGGKQ